MGNEDIVNPWLPYYLLVLHFHLLKIILKNHVKFCSNIIIEVMCELHRL